MFNLEKSLYFRFSIISGLICVLLVKFCINLSFHAKYFATFLLGETLLVLLGFLLVFLIIPCLALIMLSLDFLFTEKVRAKKSLNNSFFKVICYILFCISQMIFCILIPISVITNIIILMPFLLILIGSIIYYCVRIEKNKTVVNIEKIEISEVENQNKTESLSALIISILIFGLLFMGLLSISVKTSVKNNINAKIEKKKIPVNTEQKQKSNIQKRLYMLKDSSNKILNDDIFSDIWDLKDNQYIVTLLSSNKSGVIDKDGKYIIPPKYENIRPIMANFYCVNYKDENNNKIMYLLNKNGNKLLSANYIDEKTDINNKEQYIITSENSRITGKELKSFTLYDKNLKKLFSFKSENDGEINEKYIIIKNNEKESVLDLKGKTIIPYKYSEINDILEYNNEVFFQVYNSETKKYTIINKIGKEIIPPCHKVKNIDNNNGLIKVIENNKYLHYNFKGEIINPEELKKYKSIDTKSEKKESVNFKVSGYDFCTKMGYGYYSCTYNYYPPFTSGRADVFNPKGKKIYNSLTSKEWDCNENFIIKSNEIYDLENNKRIKIKSYKMPINIKEDRFLINQNGKNIIIDKYKNELIKQEYTQIEKLSYFMAKFKEQKAKEILYKIENNGKFGVINDKGEIIIPVEYEYIGFEKYGLTDDKFVAKKNGKYGYINYKNEIVADFIFDEEPYYLLPNGNVFIKMD